MDINLEKITGSYGTYYCYSDDIITSKLKLYGAYTRNELAMVLDFIATDDIVFDVGAHIGTFSIPIALKVGKQGKVYSYEANPNTYEVLNKNVQMNGLESIVTTNLGMVTNQPENYSMVDISQNTGASFCVVEESQTLEQNQKPDNYFILDDFFIKNNLTRINFIKIDVEGAELKVLKGAQTILKKYKPIIYIEINRTSLSRFNISPLDLESFLLDLGYVFYQNVGQRNSRNNYYAIKKLNKLTQKRNLFDLLAIHPANENYSSRYQEIINNNNYLNPTKFPYYLFSKTLAYWNKK